MSVYSFITEPWRYAEKFDAAIRSTYPLSRIVQIDGTMTSLADADTMATTLFNILKAPRLRFTVEVLSTTVINLSMFDGQTPCAMLTHPRFDLQAGKLIVIPDFTIDPGAGRTILRCWG